MLSSIEKNAKPAKTTPLMLESMGPVDIEDEMDEDKEDDKDDELVKVYRSEKEIETKSLFITLLAVQQHYRERCEEGNKAQQADEGGQESKGARKRAGGKPTI